MENITGTAVSAIGYSHIKKTKPCQDNSLYWDDKKYAAVVVCDGHGGDKHFRSEIGSQYAVEVCNQAVEDFVLGSEGKNEEKRLYEMLESLGKYIIFSWREKVKLNFEQNPFSQDEVREFTTDEIIEINLNPHIAYGSTLILVILTKKKYFIIKLGDGEVRLLTEDKIINPMMQNNQLLFGRTFSLCNNNSSNKMEYLISDIDETEAFILTSDGVYNSFASNDAFENFCLIVKSQSDDMRELHDMLVLALPVLSQKGSGDDMSIGIIKINNKFQ